MARVPPPSFDGAAPTDAVNRSVLAHQPELLRAFLRLYGTLWSHGVVDPPTKEVARMRNARVTGCRYCRNVRFAAAREQGLTENLVAQIDDGFEDSALSERHKAVIRYADVFLTDPAALTDELRADMLRHFRPDQIVELTAGLALFMGFSKIAIVLGQEPEDMPTTVIPTPVRPD
jgi:AhpD family alkylhydroperoxidase